MGVVYHARQVQLHREVAVKMILAGAHAGEKELSRFRTEAEAIARLQHPNIVQIFEIGEQNGLPFISLELVSGGSLDKKLAGNPQDPRAAAALVRTLAQAIHAAHQAGVIHRDLKPANVLLARDGAPKITDFGLAKRLDEAVSQTQSGAVMGTPSYMAPEQAAGKTKDVGAPADVYALGAILYEMLTGNPPFKAPTPMDTILQVIAHEPVPPSRQQPKVPRDLETICLKCLQKEPTKRYASAEKLAEDLCRFLAGQPIVARPVGMLELLWKWVKRRPATAALIAVLVLSGVVSMVLAVWALGERDDAITARKDADARAEDARKAGKRADDNLRIAQENDAIQRAALDFVERRIFAAARPEAQEGGLGHDVKLADAIAAALPYVEQTFKDQPLIEARLRTSIGKSFLYLGKPSEAEKQFAHARQLFTERLGPEHRDTLSSMHNLANSYHELGLNAEALKLREETLKLRTSKLGPHDPDTLASMSTLAFSYYMIGENAKSLSLQEKTQVLCKSKLGPDHPTTLWSMGSLSSIYNRLGRYSEALKLRKEILELRRAKVGLEHPDALHAMYSVALCHELLHQYKDAFDLFDKTLQGRKAKLGPRHPNTLLSMWGKATCLLKLGRGDEALGIIDTYVKLAPETWPQWPNILELLELRLHHFAKKRDAMGCQKTAEMWEKLKYDEKLKLTGKAPFIKAAVMRAVTAAVYIQDPNIAAADRIRLAKREADQAMAWLQRSDSKRLLESGDMMLKELEVLRDREDFKKLLKKRKQYEQKQ
jgi:tetratricopeptide (TPR) repeat protein